MFLMTMAVGPAVACSLSPVSCCGRKEGDGGAEENSFANDTRLSVMVYVFSTVVAYPGFLDSP